jgi:hypothetical protein
LIAEQGFSRSVEELDVAAARLTAAVAINRRRLAFAFAVRATIFAVLVGGAVTGGVGAFFSLVSHFSILLLVVGVCRSVRGYSSSQRADSARVYRDGR